MVRLRKTIAFIGARSNYLFYENPRFLKRYPVPEFKKLPEDKRACNGLRVFLISEHENMPACIVCKVVQILEVDGEHVAQIHRLSQRERDAVLVPKKFLRLS